MAKGILVIDDYFQNLRCFPENISSACEKIGVEAKTYYSLRPARVAELLREGKELSLIIYYLDDVHSGIDKKGNMSERCVIPEAADRLHGRYPNIAMLGLACCVYHAAEWHAKRRDYEIFSFPPAQDMNKFLADRLKRVLL